VYQRQLRHNVPRPVSAERRIGRHVVQLRQSLNPFTDRRATETSALDRANDLVEVPAGGSSPRLGADWVTFG
jgi:hypothetical protein